MFRTFCHFLTYAEARPRMARRRKGKEAQVESIGARIVRLRTDLGLSQFELAMRVPANPASVSRWETGRVKPSRLVRGKLAEALGVTVDEIMGVQAVAPRPVLAPVRDRRQPVLAPLRESVGRVEAIGDQALRELVTQVVAMVNRRWPRAGI
jgi:transcriptional regulator with XRE-family HTH domain